MDVTQLLGLLLAIVAVVTADEPPNPHDSSRFFDCFACTYTAETGDDQLCVDGDSVRQNHSYIKENCKLCGLSVVKNGEGDLMRLERICIDRHLYNEYKNRTGISSCIQNEYLGMNFEACSCDTQLCNHSNTLTFGMVAMATILFAFLLLQ